MVKIVNYEDAAANPDEGYIYKDVRPLYFAPESGVPAGCIMLWSGSIVSIPAGWVLCNGSNGTPDLRDRFVTGAGTTYAVGAKGGEATHALSTAELAVHNHTASSDTVAGHTHSYGDYYAPQDLTNVAGGSGPVQARLTNSDHTRTTASDGSHSHVITVNNAGSGTAHENRPPYYALAYIMKT